jgi:tRNA(Ile)-lysidine synthase
LRQRVLPLIAERWPAYRKVIARAARNLAESAQLLDELAAIDSQTCVIDGTIALDPVKLLSRERATNLLRHFLRQRGLLMPDRAQLEATLSQLLNARRDASACAVLGEFALRRYRDRIHLVKHASPPDSGWCAAWRGESDVRLPYGVLAFSHSTGDGISLARLLSSDVTVRIRKGGERFHPDRNRPRRSLKNLLQENAIPPWQRERLPLLFSGETLVWAAGIGVDAKFQCAPREEGLVLRWEQ